jgi:heavy metal efflux system protein
VPFSLILIFGLLYSLFNSLLECLLTLSGITFAIAGGVLALYISGLNFSISAAIGFVSLFGVSVMNGILLMTYYGHAKLRGEPPLETMFHAASTRMRPLLMTGLCACIGLFPAAISAGIGSQVQRPLATVIVGGMFVGPIMLLLVVPALKMMFPGREEKKIQTRTSQAGRDH